MEAEVHLQFCPERGNRGWGSHKESCFWSVASGVRLSEIKSPSTPYWLATFFNLFKPHWLNGDEKANELRSFNRVLFITGIFSINIG